MIIQALNEYYERKAADPDSDIPPFGWELKEIPFIVVLDQKGSLVTIEDTREGEGKKKKGKVFLVPQGVKKTSGIAANLLWDSAAYVFGLDTKNKPQRAAMQKEAFLHRLKEELGELPIIRSVIQFLETVTNEVLSQQAVWQEIVDTNPFISFRMNTDLNLICRRPEVIEKISILSASSTTGEIGVCLVTGKVGAIKSLHTAIKGVYGAQTSGANIVSFNLDPFCSYGKKQGYNAPMISETEFNYTTALNLLLRRGSNQRISVGDASTVFWSEKETRFESDFSLFFQEPPKDDPGLGTEKIKQLLDSIHTGTYVDDDGDIKFYILGLAPNAARISIRFWHMGTISQFAKRIKQYFDDFAIVKPPNEPEYYSIWRILVNIATQDKSENIPPNLAGDFMRAILEGTPYPATLLQAALRRIRSDTEYRVKPVRAALIKAYLNRYYRFYPNESHKEVGVSLDKYQPSVGYHLGRLFAVLEKIQEEANPNLNATIRERYYGAACAQPVTVFANLLRLKNHHLAKLENKGRAVNFEIMLSEILANVEDFPAYLDLHEQGRFAVGYYHQRQWFYSKKNETRKGDLND